MKILFKYVVLLAFVFTLSACGRMGDLTSNESGQIDSGESTSSTY
ncbi:lipoprotein [Candidatus Thioglobus sp.]|jgi:predicted small lipoprotein YifL|nr:lipoprotein [Candidatus Thioglobus sp.]MDC1417512.1 lipoprotein [Candidatus Thioglobus sp.]